MNKNLIKAIGLYNQNQKLEQKVHDNIASIAEILSTLTPEEITEYVYQTQLS